VIPPHLAERADALAANRIGFVHATVVRAQRPTSVRPGDAALVLADGTIEGFVGGACAESSVRLHGLRALETGEAVLLRIVPEGHDDAEEEGSVTVANPCLSGGALEIFLEPRLPAPRLAVVGDTPVAQALADLGVRVGFAVGAEPADDDAALVVASHGRDEEAALARALDHGVPYVGLVASRRRGAAVAASLDVPDELRERLHTPAGLDIGARTPEEIALSILAEIVALRHRVTAAAPATAVDPMCGMEVAITADAISLERDGERVYFCSEGCRERYGAPR
jgi:xanthine dehydrogenase accessory factor